MAVPIVRVVYERGAFDQSASGSLAASCLWHGDVCFGTRCAGAVFYALGDGITPFRVSMVYISQRSACLCFCTNFRRTGFSSGNRGVNLVSMLLLFWLLDRKQRFALAAWTAHLRLDWQLCGGSSQLG